MNEHLHVATDSSIYLRTNTLRLLIAACLNASQKCRDCVQLNKSAREEYAKRFPKDWILDILELTFVNGFKTT